MKALCVKARCPIATSDIREITARLEPGRQYEIHLSDGVCSCAPTQSVHGAVCVEGQPMLARVSCIRCHSWAWVRLKYACLCQFLPPPSEELKRERLDEKEPVAVEIGTGL